MLRGLRLPLVAAAVVAGLAGIPSTALAQGNPATPPTYADISAEERPGWVNPTARASCPFCVIVAVNVVRAAVVMRRAQAARAVVVAAKSAGKATRLAEKVTRAQMRRVQAEARVISRRGSRWLKKKWPSFKAESQACLSTVAVMKTSGFLLDLELTRDEWHSWTSSFLFFPPASLVEEAQMKFPIRFEPKVLARSVAEEVASCTLGVMFSKRLNKNMPTPK